MGTPTNTDTSGSTLPSPDLVKVLIGEERVPSDTISPADWVTIINAVLAAILREIDYLPFFRTISEGLYELRSGMVWEQSEEFYIDVDDVIDQLIGKKMLILYQSLFEVVLLTRKGKLIYVQKKRMSNAMVSKITFSDDITLEKILRERPVQKGHYLAFAILENLHSLTLNSVAKKKEILRGVEVMHAKVEKILQQIRLPTRKMHREVD